MLGCKVHERFNLIFGTSTGAIIATLLALGFAIWCGQVILILCMSPVLTRRARKERRRAITGETAEH
jgi:hypothetical protein